MYSGQHPYGPRRQRRWSFVSWWFTLILIVPILGILVALLWGQLFANSDIEGRVLDAYTGNPVSDARVELGDASATTNGDGNFGLDSGESTSITVSRDGYENASYEVNGDEDEIEIALRPTTMSGTVIDRVNEEPLPGIEVQAVVDGSVVSSTQTDDDGTFLLTDVPDNAEIVFANDDYADVTEPVDGRTELSVSMRPAVVTGTVTDANGEPIEMATVAIGDVWAETIEDGTFRLEDAPESGQAMIKAPGYKATSHELSDELQLDVTLEEKHVRAIYVTAAAAGDEQRFQELLDLVDRTELNAMVIDIKDSTGQMFYDSQVGLAQEIGAVNPQYDVQQVLNELEERDIYAIARQVIFEDPVLAEARPDLAIQNSEGGIWTTWNGVAWLNAYEEDIWDYNIEIALEATALGFDEIQYDYMRFPSDGPLDQAEYGVDEHNSDTRREAIANFLARSHEALMPTHAYLAGDIFGLTLWEMGDGGIGQNLESIVPYLDYLNPMIYPSHFYEGSMGFEVPNDHPYEVILYSLENAAERIPDFTQRIRPWLQDFSYGAGIEYGPAEVRAQIDASDDFAAPGWMLWSASSDYHEEALEAAD